MVNIMKPDIAHAMRSYVNRHTCRSGSRPRLFDAGIAHARTGISFALLLLLLISTPLPAEVNASLDRNTIYDGDTVTLTIETTDRNHSGEPDLAVLQKDFDVLGSSNSTQVQITNGRRTDRHQWHIELAPKNSGDVTVPAIRVGDDETRPLQLSVKKQPAAVAAASGQPVFIKVSIEPADATAWVQQQIQYTLQLYFRESLAEGSFDGPNVENAIVERLGEDSQHTTTVNGEQYQVIERHYAIFPEQSGKLVIPAVVFDGRMAGEPLQQRQSTGMSSMMERIIGRSLMRAPGKRIRLRSKAITLDVRARPASYEGKHWLPSEQVVLSDSWAEGPPEFHAGEPVARTITLEAKGLESSHLPDISLTAPAGMRLYPEKPEYTTRTDGESVYGSNKQAVAYVPTAAGRITIPEIKVDWWDTAKQQQRSAVLPAWEVNVLPGEAGLVQAPLPLDPVDLTDGADQTAAANVADVAVTSEPPGSGLRWWLLLAGLLVVSLLLLLFMLHRKQQRGTPVTASRMPSGKQQIRAAGALLEQACRDNDPQAAARALLQWAAVNWPDDAPRNLGSLALRLVAGGQEIRELDQALYATGSQAWQGNALWQIFNKGLEEVSKEGAVLQEGLSPLYPY
ncbi:MAG TPA: hypothetical protein DDW55_03180 [Gammaproteobacteria bacterium]|nr:hypothetical protein [Gammaproteobacteria bacterium]